MHYCCGRCDACILPLLYARLPPRTISLYMALLSKLVMHRLLILCEDRAANVPRKNPRLGIVVIQFFFTFDEHLSRRHYLLIAHLLRFQRRWFWISLHHWVSKICWQLDVPRLISLCGVGSPVSRSPRS
ncbi:hypothetical protein P153DRAFT_53080 [Dothidotthia symphoricarpi CBS 119687]|uniref:Uncharacterized protein n=1 Tax=Dothidotthia symphoricarpi CBS 119687 TaxID=1392245 RepID=A0A6A6A6N7_9PLEO|nr:uncharacterized protein P153DRAFT_53080 [Dothidotthia symphoricarpi CBS 119687]KAF2127652.1 hypothetical protein P153DRAFT_53080 [Dothidotthia symphoricarpi CBS 119687]